MRASRCLKKRCMERHARNAGRAPTERSGQGAAAAGRSLDATAHSLSGSRRMAHAPWPLTGRPFLKLFLVWALLMAAVVSALAAYQYVSLLGELARQSDALQVEASRRADQHDAHVTALSAVAQAQQGRIIASCSMSRHPFCNFTRVLTRSSWFPQRGGACCRHTAAGERAGSDDPRGGIGLYRPAGSGGERSQTRPLHDRQAQPQ